MTEDDLFAAYGMGRAMDSPPPAQEVRILLSPDRWVRCTGSRSCATIVRRERGTCSFCRRTGSAPPDGPGGR
jgi:hypothetical protein